MVNPITPLRESLRRAFQGDERTVRAIEQLFENSEPDLPEVISDILTRIDAREQIAAPSGAELGQLKKTLRALTNGSLVLVTDKYDFPASSGGEITLPDNVAYLMFGTIDLEGDYLQGGRNTSIAGGSSENTRLLSTGLSSSIGLLTSEWSITLRDITLDGVSGGKLLDLDASSNANQALDWRNVNFENTDNIGEIVSYNNFVGETLGILGAAGWTFSGTVGTIAFANTLFSGTSTGTILTIPAACVVERRFRVIYSAVVVPTGGTGFDVSASATIPVEGYIFDTCNFAGGGTYLAGLDYTFNKARFIENRGIINTAVVSGYYMQNNVTTTVISATGTPVKVAGTTTETAISQKFDNSTTNRALYEGAIPRNFEVQIVFSLSSGNNNKIGFYVAKNGTELSESETYVTTDSGGRLENGYVQVLVALEDGDYIEAFVENDTSTSNVLVDSMNLIVKEVGA